MKSWPGLFLNLCMSSWCKGTAPECPLFLWGPSNAAVGLVMGGKEQGHGEKPGSGEKKPRSGREQTVPQALKDPGSKFCLKAKRYRAFT